jgi:hypothetical protein
VNAWNVTFVRLVFFMIIVGESAFFAQCYQKWAVVERQSVECAHTHTLLSLCLLASQPVASQSCQTRHTSDVSALLAHQRTEITFCPVFQFTLFVHKKILHVN